MTTATANYRKRCLIVWSTSTAARNASTENDKATNQAKKLGFKSEAHMRSFFVSSIMAYKRKKETTTLHGNKRSRHNHFQVEETEDGEILGSSADNANEADDVLGDTNNNDIASMTLSDLDDDEIEEIDLSNE